MVDGIQFKVCGLTSLLDAEFADACGADYLGFILHPGSPRRIALDRYKAIAPRLAGRRKVAVSVEPGPEALAAMIEAGFDRFQIHFSEEVPISTLEEWSRAVGKDRLWLAPKLPPGSGISEAILPLAGTFLFDTFQPEGFGGSGRTGDWKGFALHCQLHPSKTWILAGGLNPENIGSALVESGARFVDVNSGVESGPGVKDHLKLQAFVLALRSGRSRDVVNLDEGDAGG
jgi:phosphoribosylanthranilate isomerase